MNKILKAVLFYADNQTSFAPVVGGLAGGLITVIVILVVSLVLVCKENRGNLYWKWFKSLLFIKQILLLIKTHLLLSYV